MKSIFISISILCIITSLMGLGLKGERYALDGLEYFQRGDYVNAITMFKAADDAAQGSKPEYFYWLGRLNIAVADTANAKYWFNHYLESNDTAFASQVQGYLEILNRQTLIFEKITMREMPSYINSRNSDYGAVATPDGKYLYFTSLRPAPYEKENIWRAERLNTLWGYPELVTDLNTNKNEAIGSFSVNGEFAYLSGNYEKGKIDGDIYVSRYSDKWHTPFNISDVSSEQVDVQPTVYNDELMFFTSSRSGGYGGTDIYVSVKNGDSWDSPVNLGPNINTDANEQTPFLDWDGKTLFFASTGHTGFGGYDIFKTVRIGDSLTGWSLPENLGLPINSIQNDRYYYHIKNTNEATFSTDRKADNFERLYALNVIYAPREFMIADSAGKKITVFDTDKTSPISGTNDQIETDADKIYAPIAMTGKVVDEEGNPIQTDVQFNFVRFGNKLQEIATTDSTGQFVFNAPRSTKYTVVVNKDGYFLYSEEIQPALTDTTFVLNITLKKMEAKKVFVFNNIQFKFDNSFLTDDSYPIVNEIVLTLLNNADIKVEISGHTCNIGTAKYNQWLSERRAQRVVDYVISKGIDPARLSFKGYGLTMPLNDNSTAALKKLNRRVEVKVME